MKKKILGIAVMAAIALTAGWNISQSENDIQLSDLALDNIEALASGESSDEFEQATGCRAVMEKTTCAGKDGNTHLYATRSY